MSERRLEEIIGWQRCTESWPVENRSGVGYEADPNVPYRMESCDYWLPPGEHDRGAISERDVTVDDLLAWLRGQGRSVQISGTSPGHMIQVRVTRPDTEPGAYVPFSRARHSTSLLEALTDAVKSIDDGSHP